jgi:hypothetical protein
MVLEKIKQAEDLNKSSNLLVNNMSRWFDIILIIHAFLSREIATTEGCT